MPCDNPVIQIDYRHDHGRRKNISLNQKSTDRTMAQTEERKDSGGELLFSRFGPELPPYYSPLASVVIGWLDRSNRPSPLKEIAHSHTGAYLIITARHSTTFQSLQLWLAALSLNFHVLIYPCPYLARAAITLTLLNAQLYPRLDRSWAFPGSELSRFTTKDPESKTIDFFFDASAPWMIAWRNLESSSFRSDPLRTMAVAKRTKFSRRTCYRGINLKKEIVSSFQGVMP